MFRKNYIKLLKKYGISLITDKYHSFVRPGYIDRQWKKAIKNDGFQGIGKNPKKIIVSLTSFPARIDIVHKTIRSIMLQSKKPDVIILWLTYEEFPEGEKSLPKQLLELKKYGLTIDWTNNIRSFKKLIPTLKMYPEDIIVTADDDIYYSENWLLKLYKGYEERPEEISCHRAFKINYENERYCMKGCKNRKVFQGTSSFVYELTGVGGVLYPPHVLHADVMKEDIFWECCKTTDDIWFWMMALKNQVKIHLVEKFEHNLVYVEGTQEGPCLWKINDIPEVGNFWINFYNVLDKYPEIDKLLKQEIGNN